MADLPTKSRVKLEQKFTPLPRQQEVQRVGKGTVRADEVPCPQAVSPELGRGCPFPSPGHSPEGLSHGLGEVDSVYSPRSLMAGLGE